MRKFAIVDIATGEVKQTYQWLDDRDFPSNIPIDEGCELQETDMECVDCFYHTDLKGNFFIIEPTETELELERLKRELMDYENVLSDFQEATWQGLGIDETKLPQEWQDKLTYKRSLRKQIAELGGV